jgi:predicted Zn-dependent protease
MNEANAAIDHALLLNPNNSMYNVEKGVMLGMQGNNKDTEIYVDKGLMLDPNNYIGWNTKGIIEKLKAIKR